MNYNDPTAEQASILSDTFTSWAGCEDIACLRSQPVEALLQAQQTVEYYLGTPGTDYYVPGINNAQTFTPFVDGSLVRGQTEALIRSGGLVSLLPLDRYSV